MIYSKQIGDACYCVDPIKIKEDEFDIQITKLTIKFIGSDTFIPAEYKQLTSMEVPYESVYPTLDTAVEHASTYFSADADLELIDLGRDSWDLRKK